MMDRNTQQQNDWRGPEIYVHLEFRVAWSKKQQTTKPHEITYRSRNLRERSPAFPRQVAAPNTNYLAAIHDFQKQKQPRGREGRPALPSNDPRRFHQMQEYYQSDQPPPQRGLLAPGGHETERSTRADGRGSSHERGRSAPPPIGENPWDVSVPQGRDRNCPPPDRRKALPAEPSQFRLGEGGQPWSTWSMPLGFDPDSLPVDEEHTQRRSSSTYATNPTMVSTFSPSPDPVPVPSSTDAETGRAQEMGALAAAMMTVEPHPAGRTQEITDLSAAMMTVDNGFENQWWNQGRRQTMLESDDEVRSPVDGGTFNSMTSRWSADPGSADTLTNARNMTGIVSPMTEAAFSPAPGFATLYRTMSTRSEELWLTERLR